MKTACKKILTLAALAIVLTCLLGMPESEAKGESTDPADVRLQLLKKAADSSRRRLQASMEKDGFFSTRAALNIWRSRAIEAGVFDEAEYEALKKRIYKASINDNLKWFETYVLQKNYADARVCLQLWRIHAKEIGAFDEAKFIELNKKLK